LLTWPLAIAGANIFHPSRMALYYDPTGTGALPLFAPVFRAGLSRRSFAPVFRAGLSRQRQCDARPEHHLHPRHRLDGLDDGAGRAALDGLDGWRAARGVGAAHQCVADGGMVATAPNCAALFYCPLII